MNFHLSLLPLLLTPLFTASSQAENGVLIEAESFSKKFSESKTFASPTHERAASGRRALYRFFEKGYVLYRFTLPADGAYNGWLRYGAKNEIRLGVSLDPAREPKFKRATLPATGGYVGEGVWAWARIFTAKLAAGEHTLAIRSAPIRPDCIFIAAHEKPTDALIKRKRPPLAPKTVALLRKPLTPVRPSWLDGALDYKLPAWFERYRVHAHTRLGPPYIKRAIFFSAAKGFKEMGVHVFARHIKSGREGAWWPSKVGAILPQAKDRNLAKEIIDNAHKEGCRILVYHRHLEDEYTAKLHPDWVCRDWNGKPLSSRRGDYMCLNSPYADYFLVRALELVDLGADGFYFDEVHMPKTGCWCKFCKNKFKEETGLDHPAEADPDDPLWRKLIDFNNLTIERTFLKWRKAIHERNPNLVMLIGSNTWPTISDRHTTNRLYRIADSMKTEFSLPARQPSNVVFPLPRTMKPVERDAKIALGYTLARDSADGRPAHVWTHGLLNEVSTLYATAGIVTHGCIANLDIPENTIPNMMFKKAFALGDKVSPYFAGARPLRWAAIHYSEYARDKYAADPADAWRRVLYPVYGAYLALLRARLPVGFITDSQLEEGCLGGYKTLFLPAPQQLTDRMRAVVHDFKANGGLVVEQQESWQWHDPRGGQEEAIHSFMEAINAAAQKAPVQVIGGPVKMHAVPFIDQTGRRLTISLANDFSWVYTGRKRDRKGRKLDLSKYLNPPPPCKGAAVIVRGYGRPTRVFDAVTGNALTYKAVDDRLEIAAPDFDYMAVIVVDYRPAE